MLRRIFKVYNSYQEAKQEVAQETVRALEARTNPFFAVAFFALTVLLWLAATLTPLAPVPLYEESGFYPVIVILIISYFTFYFGSKLVFKPTAEELADDTSVLAIFSACRRREIRSLVSVGLAVLHTVIFVLYLVSKDPKLMKLF